MGSPFLCWDPQRRIYGTSPTEKKIKSKAVDIYRIVNGKLAEYWNVTDNVNIFMQVGAIEVTEKGKQLFSDDAK